MADSRFNRTVSLVAGILMPILLFMGGLLCCEIRDINARLRMIELYVTKIGTKLQIEPPRALSVPQKQPAQCKSTDLAQIIHPGGSEQ